MTSDVANSAASESHSQHGAEDRRPGPKARAQPQHDRQIDQRDIGDVDDAQHQRDEDGSGGNADHGSQQASGSRGTLRGRPYEQIAAAALPHPPRLVQRLLRNGLLAATQHAAAYLRPLCARSHLRNSTRLVVDPPARAGEW